MVQMLPQWLTKPEVIFPMGLTVILFIGSLYAGEIRRSFHWPRKATVKSILRFSENELEVIEMIHGDAYHLVLWLARSVFDIFNILFWVLLFGYAANMTTFIITRHFIPSSFVLTLLSPVTGVIFAKLRRDYGTIKALYDYDNTVARLTKNIELCKRELGLPPYVVKP